jgi:hypothetical protein
VGYQRNDAEPLDDFINLSDGPRVRPAFSIETQGHSFVRDSRLLTRRVFLKVSAKSVAALTFAGTIAGVVPAIAKANTCHYDYNNASQHTSCTGPCVDLSSGNSGCDLPGGPYESCTCQDVGSGSCIGPTGSYYVSAYVEFCRIQVCCISC